MVRMTLGFLLSCVALPLIGLAVILQDAFLVWPLFFPISLVSISIILLSTHAHRAQTRVALRSFSKTTIYAGLFCLIQSAVVLLLLRRYAPTINLGNSLAEFHLGYYLMNLVLPVIGYSAVLGATFWKVALSSSSTNHVLPASPNAPQVHDFAQAA